MTTFINFVPSQTAPAPPFSFQASLDGQVYNCFVAWLLAAQRFYLSIYDLDGTLIVNKALIGSPTGVPISSISWSQTTGLITVETTIPHGYKVGMVIGLTLSGNAPTVLNGEFDCAITGPSTFTFAASNPGQTTQLGTASYDINLVSGYFTTSTMVFRQQSQQFEISP